MSKNIIIRKLKKEKKKRTTRHIKIWISIRLNESFALLLDEIETFLRMG